MKWALIHTAQGESEALVIRSMLEDSGIPVKTAKESAGRIFAIQMDGLGEVRIFVPEDRAEEAKTLLNPVDRKD